MSQCIKVEYVLHAGHIDRFFCYDIASLLFGGYNVRKVVLRMNEENKYLIIKKLVESNGNKGRISSVAIPLDIKNKTIKLCIDEYAFSNFTHFCEIVQEYLNIRISNTILNKWLREEYIISPKAKKENQKKLLKKILKSQLENSSSKKVQNEIKETIALIDEKEAHPRRPRCKYMGEMIQMDASSYEWISSQIWHLYLAVDDSTGRVDGAYFNY